MNCGLIHRQIPFEDLTDVRKIKLADNCLVQLRMQHVFFGLQHLNLSGVQLVSLPPEFSTMAVNIRTIDLSGNQLRDISTLEKAPNLKRLSLVGNQLTSLSHITSVLLSLSSLEVLDVRMNPMTMTFYPPPIPENSKSWPVKAADKLSLGKSELAELFWTKRDSAYMKKLPSSWVMKRRTYQGVVFMACKTLKWFDGSAVDEHWVRSVTRIVKTIRLRSKEIADDKKMH